MVRRGLLCLIGLLEVVVVSGQSLNGFDLKGASVKLSKIKRGGPPKDGIPALSYPGFVEAKRANYLNDDDRVIGVNFNGESRAYPIKILNYHELVNDKIGNTSYVVSFCPLCGSGLVFNATIKGEPVQFGVSGLLYNSDVLMYDRKTESLWSQLKNQAITGRYLGTKLEILPSTITNWKTWKDQHPNTKVLGHNTGYARDYNRTPYTGYNTTKTVYFPTDHWDDRFFSKEYILGVEINGKFKAYPFSQLAKNAPHINDSFEGKNLEISFNKNSKTAMLIKPDLKIKPTVSFWFAWYTFHPDTEVYYAESR